MKNDIRLFLNTTIYKIIILGLIIQIFSILGIFTINKDYVHQYKQYESTISDEWIKDIQMEHENTKSPSSALETAYQYSMIKYTLKEIKNNYLKMYPNNKQFIDNHFTNLSIKVDNTEFTSILGYDYLLKSNQYFLITIVILIIMFFSNGEDPIKELRLSTKQNRNAFKINKLKMNLLISSGVWLFYTLTIVLLILAVLGFHGENVWYKEWSNDFNLYGFTVLEYTLRVLSLSYLTTITITMIVTTISLYIQKKNKSLLVNIIALWMPPLILNKTSLSDILYFFPVNFISSGYLHKNLEGVFVFNTFIPSYIIAVIILILWLVISTIFILKKDLRRESGW